MKSAVLSCGACFPIGILFLAGVALCFPASSGRAESVIEMLVFDCILAQMSRSSGSQRGAVSLGVESIVCSC